MSGNDELHRGEEGGRLSSFARPPGAGPIAWRKSSYDDDATPGRNSAPTGVSSGPVAGAVEALMAEIIHGAGKLNDRELAAWICRANSTVEPKVSNPQGRVENR